MKEVLHKLLVEEENINKTHFQIGIHSLNCLFLDKDTMCLTPIQMKIFYCYSNAKQDIVTKFSGTFLYFKCIMRTPCKSLGIVKLFRESHISTVIRHQNIKLSISMLPECRYQTLRESVPKLSCIKHYTVSMIKTLK